MTDIPHFVVPLSFDRGAAVVCEQDSADELVSCMLSILVCPLGFRVELPEFGVADPTFSMAQVNADEINRALRQWEPRAHPLLTQQPDVLDALKTYVTVDVAVPSGD